MTTEFDNNTLQKQPDGQITEKLSSPLSKIFRFPRRANQRYQLAPSRPDKRGGSRSSRNAGRDAVDADVPLTNGADAYGEDVWS